MLHLEVTSYLLVVLTFSVGFLSTRRHAHFDVVSKYLADRSWELRQALIAGQNLGPRELAEDISAVNVESDSVSTFARWVNVSFFVGACVVFVLGLFAYETNTELVMLCLLFVSTALVFSLGEYDVRWMAAKERDLATSTVLGQLAKIDRSLRDYRGGNVEAEITSLREAYPDWLFARELDLVVSHLAEGKVADKEEGFKDLLELRGDLYAAPLLVAESRLKTRDPIGALQGFHIVLPRCSKSANFQHLGRVLGFAAGLPKDVFEGSAGSGSELVEDSGIDVGLRTLPVVRAATHSFNEFCKPGDLSRWLRLNENTAGWLVGSLAFAPEAELDPYLELVFTDQYRGALNSAGIVCLARGMVTESLRIFEAAIRSRPNSSTSHWGRSVACARRSWKEAALESLHRAKALDPDSPTLIELTERNIEGIQTGLGRQALTDSVLEHLFGDQVSDLTRIRLALLGIDFPGSVRTSNPRGQLVARVIEAALTEDVQ